MLGSTPISAVLGSGVDNTNHEAVRSFIRAACGQGLSLLLIQPGTKIPADMRTPHKRRKDDKEAQEAARQAGRADWQRVKSPSGLALASSDAKVVLKYLDRYIEVHGDDVAVNLAIEVGSSGLVVVDCDTRAQVEAFLTEAEAPLDMPPTVATPGAVNAAGETVHSNGGHFYFTVPEGVELPKNVGAMNWGGENGFAVLWNRRYVLIPPSTRPEGAYELVGRDYPVPSWLVAAIHEQGSLRQTRAADREVNEELKSGIDAWADTISWSEILEPQGWVQLARPDNCGCPVYTAPGDHASPKSATAHDEGCARAFTGTNSPLHIWTDHDVAPFDDFVAAHGTTITKLQAVAVTEFGGNVGKALDELKLQPELGIGADEGLTDANLADDDELSADIGLDEDFTPPDPQPVDTPVEDSDTAEPEVDDDLGFGAELADTPFPDEVEADPNVFESEVPGVPQIAPFAHWKDMPAPEYIIDGLIEHLGFSCMIGPPGVGKSAISLDMACHIATGKSWQGRRTLKTRVLYLPGEGLAGVVQRIRAWEAAHETEVGDDLLLGNDIIQLKASKEAWSTLTEYLIRQEIGLIIFDTYARMSSGMEENSATDAGLGILRLDKVRKATNAGVMLVHHTSKNSDSARGSSALLGALDSELLIRDGWSNAALTDEEDKDIPSGKRIELWTTKQKNAPQLDEGLALLMRQSEVNNAPVITGPNGGVDPMAGTVILARPVPEPIVETAIRIRQYVDRFPQQGASRSEIAAGVRPDAYTRSRPDAAKRWKQKVAEAVDRGLRYQLIETLTGTASGQRYIPSLGTIANARSMAAAEQIGDPDDD